MVDCCNLDMKDSSARRNKKIPVGKKERQGVFRVAVLSKKVVDLFLDREYCTQDDKMKTTSCIAMSTLGLPEILIDGVQVAS